MEGSTTMTPDEILHSSDYFTCIRYGNPCILSREACAKRFEKAYKPFVYRNVSVFSRGALTVDYSPCIGCEEGEMNWAELHPGEPAAKGRPKKGRPKTTRRCSVPACNAKHEARGMCKMHYQKWYHRQRRKAREAAG